MPPHSAKYFRQKNLVEGGGSGSGNPRAEKIRNIVFETFPLSIYKIAKYLFGRQKVGKNRQNCNQNTILFSWGFPYLPRDGDVQHIHKIGTEQRIPDDVTPFYVVLKENERYPKISGFPFLFEQGRFPSSAQKISPPTTKVQRSDLTSLLTD